MITSFIPPGRSIARLNFFLKRFFGNKADTFKYTEDKIYLSNGTILCEYIWLKDNVPRFDFVGEHFGINYVSERKVIEVLEHDIFLCELINMVEGLKYNGKN